MKVLVVLFVLLQTSLSLAIDCNVIVYTEKEVLEKSFSVTEKSEGHGGQEMVLTGKFNEVTAMADGKWLGLRWTQKNELVAESINLIQTETSQPRVMITFNPKNTDEQVSIDCAKSSK